MRAILLNATLKPSPETSSTDKLARYVGEQIARHGVDVEHVRLVDHDIAPGVVAEAAGERDGWPALKERVTGADILVIATPTWLGQPASVSKLALERIYGSAAETSADGTPLAWNKVAGVLVTGNEDGAHHVIAEIAGALIDIGYTVPGQAWTYWNKGPGPGEEVYATTNEVDWTQRTGDGMAHILVNAARALAATPIPALAD